MTCISCHGEHAIADPTGRFDHIRKREMADRTCLKCHSDEEIALKYGLTEGVAATYQDSYHGLAVARGDEDAATCYDCHGVHAIQGEEHDTSPIHPDNLQETCAQCHPAATAKFARSYTHASFLVRETPIEDIVANIYILLIIGVIGFMVVHNAIIFRGSVKLRKRGNAFDLEETYIAAKILKKYRRYSHQEVWQHYLLLMSFITLVITGFALKFGDAAWVRLLGYLGLNETVRRIVHRVAASILIATALWHIVYIIASRWGRYHLREMIPTVKDIQDFAGTMKDHLKGRHSRSKFPLFDYAEKIEYWALVWGTAVMTVTGFILWFPTILGDATPMWLIKVSEAVHYWEAWLASLAILIWHFFFTIFHPDEYPGSNVMWTGQMDREEWQHKHGGFYEELEQELDSYRHGELEFEQLSPFAQEAIKGMESEEKTAP
jgi:formate dehydrogenase gamma subunit